MTTSQLLAKQRKNPGGSSGGVGIDSFDLESVDSLVNYCKEYCHYEWSNYFALIDRFSDTDVAEMGCGHGLMAVCISEYVRSIDCYDVDFRAIQFAQDLVGKLGLGGKIRCYDYSGYHTSAADESYDTVLSMDVVEHVPIPIEYLRECNRILRNDGKFILTTPNGLTTKKNDCLIKIRSPWHLTEYYPTELQDMLQSVGFEVTESYTNNNTNGLAQRSSILTKLLYFLYCNSNDKIRKFIYNVKIKFQSILASEHGSSIKYQLTEVKLDQITEDNCDVIVLVARKT